MELKGERKRVEEKRRASDATAEEARKGKTTVDLEVESAKAEAKRWKEETKRARKELDTGLARFNALVAQERGEVVSLEGQEHELIKQVEEME